MRGQTSAVAGQTLVGLICYSWGASCHQDPLGSPIYFQVVEGEPGVSDDHCLLSKVCNSKVGSFRVTSEVEGVMDLFRVSPILICRAVYIAHEGRLGYGSGLKLLFLAETPVCCIAD